MSPVPHEVLTDAIVEEIKTRICFVEPETPDDNSNSVAKVSTSKGSYYINRELYSPPTSSTSSAGSEEEALETDYIRHVQDVLKSRHSRPGSRNTPTSSDVSIRLKNGTLSVPGWLRHACTDVFFDSDWDVDLPSLPELVLDCILKVNRRYASQPTSLNVALMQYNASLRSCPLISASLSCPRSCSSVAAACCQAFRFDSPAQSIPFCIATTATRRCAV